MNKEEVDKLVGKIRTSETMNKREHFFTAYCPLCPFIAVADVTPSSTSLNSRVAEGMDIGSSNTQKSDRGG